MSAPYPNANVFAFVDFTILKSGKWDSELLTVIVDSSVPIADGHGFEDLTFVVKTR